MTDRELLELAAKAAGFFYHGTRVGTDYQNCYISTTNDTDDWFVWSPLTDDGDALRLAVRLKIDIRFPQDNDMYVDAGDCDAYTVYLIDAGNDRAAATRRAIVRAAAHIGSTK